MTEANLDAPPAASIDSSAEAGSQMSPLLAYKDIVDLASAGLSRAAFPQFFAPRPAPMTLTLAR